MANILDNYLNLLEGPMQGLNINRFDISQMITRGVRNPIGSAEVNELYGSSDDFMERYKEIEKIYKFYLGKEMDNNVSIAQKRMLDAAQSSPIMNFSLIRNRGNRNQLIELIRGSDGLNMEGLLTTIGPPSTPLPSSNLVKEAGKYGVDTRSANHHAANLLSSLTISIDPTKQGAAAFGFGTSALPSSTTLENMGNTRQRISDIIASGRNVKIQTLDTETSGLGGFSEVRSIAATEMEISSPGTSGRLISGTSNPVASAHFSTREMQMITIEQNSTGLRTSLAEAAFETEKGVDSFSGSLKMRDLLTPEGRLAAVDDYKNIFRGMANNDFILFHNAKFDIEKITSSVFNLGEDFFGDAEAAGLFKNFQGMVEQRKSNQQLRFS